MHMTDVLLSPTVAVIMFAVSGVVTCISARKAWHTYKVDKIFVMCVLAALLFVGQLIKYAIPGTGVSGRILGGILVSSVLGPYVGFLTMLIVLAAQALWFADGGLMAFGANVWNIAFCGSIAGYFLVYFPIIKSKIKSIPLKLILASILGAVVTHQISILSMCAEMVLSGMPDWNPVSFLRMIQPVYLMVGILEGFGTAGVLLIVYKMCPGFLEVIGSKINFMEEKTVKRFMILTVILVFIAGGICRLFSSENPDVIKWVQSDGIRSTMSDKAEELQRTTEFMPDYTFVFDPEHPLAPSVAGITGVMIVMILSAGMYELGKFSEKIK